MDRRDFLSLSSIAGISALRRKKKKKKGKAAAPPTPPPPNRVQIAAGVLDEVTVPELQSRQRQKLVTAERLTEIYLSRIEAIDRSGPTLRAVIEVNPEALALARALDAEFRVKGPRSPLHGMPVLIKDNIDTGDSMQTTAGSLALAGNRLALIRGWPRACGLPAPSSWEKQISVNGRTFAPVMPPAGGADAVAKPKIPTRLTAIPPALVLVLLPLSQRVSLQSVLAPKPMGPSSAHLPYAVSLASNQRLASLAERGSFRFPTAKTPLGQWPEPFGRPHCSSAS